jgi:hypothetical protein
VLTVRVMKDPMIGSGLPATRPHFRNVPVAATQAGQAFGDSASQRFALTRGRLRLSYTPIFHHLVTPCPPLVASSFPHHPLPRARV